MVPLQRRGNKAFGAAMWSLGQFCSGEVLLIYFAGLYWSMDKFKCLYGIWLIPLSEGALLDTRPILTHPYCSPEHCAMVVCFQYCALSTVLRM
jgi:hypothetical protein